MTGTTDTLRQYLKQHGRTRVTVDFSDGHCNLGRGATWREHGWLTLTDCAFRLEVSTACGGGTRIFPLSDRTAEVYLPDSDQPLVIR